MAGIRDSKTANGITYHYDTLNGKVVRQTWTQNGKEKVFDIIYDAGGHPYACVYEGYRYYYVLNQQGDVIQIVGYEGTVCAEYRYDAWGNVLSITGLYAGTLGAVNPIRYRGYYYDTETGFYYLQSRYYDPGTGRFINADSFASTGQGFLGYNMFAYCVNNPTNNTDPTGHASWGTNTVAISDCKSGLTPGFASYVITMMERKRKKAAFIESVVGILNAIRTPSNEGGTFSLGLVGSNIFFDSGAGKSYSLSVDGGYNYALQSTDTLSVASGMGASGGLSLTWTNAKYVSDLNGSSDVAGFTAIGLVGISVDCLIFVPASEPNTTKYGICVSILWGAGADIHAGTSYTQPLWSGNPISWLIDIINGGV